MSRFWVLVLDNTAIDSSSKYFFTDPTFSGGGKNKPTWHPIISYPTYLFVIFQGNWMESMHLFEDILLKICISNGKLVVWGPRIGLPLRVPIPFIFRDPRNPNHQLTH